MQVLTCIFPNSVRGVASEFGAACGLLGVAGSCGGGGTDCGGGGMKPCEEGADGAGGPSNDGDGGGGGGGGITMDSVLFLGVFETDSGTCATGSDPDPDRDKDAENWGMLTEARTLGESGTDGGGGGMLIGSLGVDGLVFEDVGGGGIGINARCDKDDGALDGKGGGRGSSTAALKSSWSFSSSSTKLNV